MLRSKLDSTADKLIQQQLLSMCHVANIVFI